MGTAGSPGRMKYACSECTGRSAGTVRPAATSAWPATCPPNTRWWETCGLTPRKMSTSIGSRSSSRISPPTSGWPAGAESAAVIVVAEPVHPDQVLVAGGVRRASGDDDHQVARLAAVMLEHRLVDLSDHLVGVPHVGHEERLHPPGQREPGAHARLRGEGQQWQRGMVP